MEAASVSYGFGTRLLPRDYGELAWLDDEKSASVR
jgi:hypothetical protein